MYATKSSIIHINDDMTNICDGVKNGTRASEKLS